MKRAVTRSVLLATAACSSAAMLAAPTGAQSRTTPTAAPDTPSADDIIVTARKRQESILNVPVVETALPKAQLERLHTVDVKDLQTVVPGVAIGHAQGPIGTLVSIRGIGTISNDQGTDTSVSLNIDGLSLGNGVAFNSGLFDLQQIEVLKGPQALFYGKGSPGGVISLRTSDPGERTELIARASYGFVAHTPRGELILSGPLSNTLKARIAGVYQQSEGYFYNPAVAVPNTGAITPTHRHAPDSMNYGIRGTVLWDPAPAFSARLKLNYVHDRFFDFSTSQLVNCPQGRNFAPSGIAFIGGDDCTLNRNINVVYMDPANFPLVGNGGVPSVVQTQKYGTLELNYHPAEALTLTSTTGYYKLDQFSVLNATNTTAAGASLAVNVDFHRRSTTEELRLNSDFSSPLNFTVGGFYEDGLINNRPQLLGNTAYRLPALLSDVQEYLAIKTYSAFGQLRWAILPRLELAGGGRFTDETRTERAYSWVTGVRVPIVLGVSRIHASNFAPEATITYRPTDDLTVFASYKQAFKSGSFSLGGVPSTGGNDSFNDEKVKGAEAGIKSRLFDRQVTLNVAGYYYKYRGLQVGAVQPSVGNLTVTKTTNAGSARSYGVDFDMTYRPRAVPGLGVRGAVTWNKATYLLLDNIPCYGGQTIALGCNQPPIVTSGGTSLFSAQDLSNTPLIRAPEWQFSGGVDYDFPLTGSLRLGLASNLSYSSSFRTYLAVIRPGNDQIQRGYAKLDLSAALKGPKDRWELALIGKNITDKLIAATCNASNYANGSVFGGQITGSTSSGAAGVSQGACNTEPGREVLLRLSLHF